MQDGLRPVETDAGHLLTLSSGFGDLGEQFVEYGAGEIAALPVEGQRFFFFGGLQCAPVDILGFGKGKLLFLIVRMCAVGTGRGRCDQRLVVTENLFVIQIKIVVSDPGGGAAFLSGLLLPGMGCCAMSPWVAPAFPESDAVLEACE